MEKNNQPIIIASIIIAVLIIVLALIFTRTDSETEAPAESAVSENEENETDENGASDGEQTTPQPDPQPTPQPTPDPDPLPDPQPDPQPQAGVFPPNWDELSPTEKTTLNPFDCNHETQWVSAEDGGCINKTTDDDDPIDPVRPPVEPDYVLLDANCYDRLAVDPHGLESVIFQLPPRATIIWSSFWLRLYYR